jgi:hypothetical protein
MFPSVAFIPGPRAEQSPRTVTGRRNSLTVSGSSRGRHRRVAAVSRDVTDLRPNHRFMLWPLMRTSWADVVPTSADAGPAAIVIPTARPLDGDVPGVDLALALSRSLGCHVLLICSGAARVEDFPWSRADGLTDRVHVLDYTRIPDEWRCRNAVLDVHGSGYDVAEKRNLALALATYLGWGQIMFLDDDMQASDASDGLNARSVAWSSLVMRQEGLAACGWNCEDFPDNSVVCHARRLAGLEQGTFIGGGALLVRVDRETPFFPDMYNEDWFFLIDVAMQAPARLAAIGLAGSISQVEYNPYSWQRVEREEMGDVLAECLMNLIEDRGAAGLGLADTGFWRKALRSRRRLIGRVAVLLRALTIARLGLGCGRRREAVRALRQARTVSRRLEPESLVAWVEAWREHRDAWRSHLDGLARAGAAVGPDAVAVLRALSGGAVGCDAPAGVVMPVGSGNHELTTALVGTS